MGFIFKCVITPITFPSHMPTRIRIFDRIVQSIRIPIIPLHPGRDNAIGGGKPSQRRVIPAGIVEHQAKVRGVRVLPRVGVVCGIGARGIADISPGFVLRIGDHSSCGIGDNAGGAEVVSEDKSTLRLVRLSLFHIRKFPMRIHLLKYINSKSLYLFLLLQIIFGVEKGDYFLNVGNKQQT